MKEPILINMLRVGVAEQTSTNVLVDISPVNHFVIIKRSAHFQTGELLGYCIYDGTWTNDVRRWTAFSMLDLYHLNKFGVLYGILSCGMLLDCSELNNMESLVRPHLV